MAKTNKKHKKYFNTFVLNKFLANEKITAKDCTFIASKINSSNVYVKSEIKKCKNYLKKRPYLLRHNPKLTNLVVVYNIPIENLIKLVLRGDLILTKRNFEKFKGILKETHGVKMPEEESYKISDISVFIKLLSFNHKPDIDVVVRSGKIKNGTDFYSNKEIYDTLKKYWDAFGVDIGTLAQTEKLRIALINQFRDKGLLAKQINNGYFSNSFTVLNEKGRKFKKYGVFLTNIAEKFPSERAE